MRDSSRRIKQAAGIDGSFAGVLQFCNLGCAVGPCACRVQRRPSISHVDRKKSCAGAPQSNSLVSQRASPRRERRSASQRHAGVGRDSGFRWRRRNIQIEFSAQAKVGFVYAKVGPSGSSTLEGVAREFCNFLSGIGNLRSVLGKLHFEVWHFATCHCRLLTILTMYWRQVDAYTQALEFDFHKDTESRLPAIAARTRRVSLSAWLGWSTVFFLAMLELCGDRDFN